MKIIKKDGRIEDFLQRKIQTSIENTAKDVGIYLNQSDLHILLTDVTSKLKALRRLTNTPTSTYEVRGIVISVLLENKFTQIAHAYLK